MMLFSKKKKYNVILLGIDTLRADHLGIYGYGRDTSPVIDEFAKNALLFKNCFSHAPRTTVSFASIFTSRYPMYHGIVDNLNPIRNMGTRSYVLDPAIPTLTEILKSKGYRTAAFTGGANIYSKVGFGRGFDFISEGHEKYSPELNHDAPLIPQDEIFYWLKECASEQFYLFIHTFAVHNSWAAPLPYRKHFDMGYKGHLLDPFLDISQSNDPKAVKERRFLYPNFIKKINHKDPADINYYQSTYDGAIRYVDNFFEKLLNTLYQLKLAEDTIIVFTSDHGEDFLEHGYLGHDQLYNELLHVPLIIKLPAIEKGCVVDQVVRSIDIAPTILDILEIRAPLPLQGVSLLSAPAMDLGLAAVSETEIHGYAVQNMKYKYIYPLNRSYGERFGELYDLEKDPNEKNNIILKNLDIAEEMFMLFEKETHKSALLSPQRAIMHIRS